MYNYDRDFAIHLALYARGIYFYIYVLSVVRAANEERYEQERHQQLSGIEISKI